MWNIKKIIYFLTNYILKKKLIFGKKTIPNIIYTIFIRKLVKTHITTNIIDTHEKKHMSEAVVAKTTPQTNINSP